MSVRGRTPWNQHSISSVMWSTVLERSPALMMSCFSSEMLQSLVGLPVRSCMQARRPWGSWVDGGLDLCLVEGGGAGGNGGLGGWGRD